MMQRGEILLPLARASMAAHLNFPAQWPDVRAPWLQEPGASFVTLHEQGALRGCIGSLEPHRSLLEDVQHNAVQAAFYDPRFPPLRSDELTQVDIEVSVLSRAEPLHVASESEALEQLVPGQDGVILEYGAHKATFLPQVWEQLPDAASFLAQLKHKAGLPAGFWHPEVRLSRYRVQVYAEEVKPR